MPDETPLAVDPFAVAVELTQQPAQDYREAILSGALNAVGDDRALEFLGGVTASLLMISDEVRAAAPTTVRSVMRRIR